MVSVRNTKECSLFGLILAFSFLSFCLGADYDYEEPKTTLSGCPWIRSKLKNGRVKIRARGRIAKFFCNSRFELVGKRFATCVHGEWNNPVPVCVTKGCSKMQEPRNGKLTDDLYGGGLLLYTCNPGYILSGPSNLYCDGKQWNREPPTCEVAVSQPQLSCDFEDPDLCGWSDDPSHDFYWLRNQFGTPSGYVGTGPSYDHTFGKSKGGFYLYLEASAPRKENDTCRIFSPVYPATNSPACFVFWYHMYGVTTGGIRVYVKPESHVFGELMPSWSKFGDQGNQWLRGNVSIAEFHENFQIIIEGIRGASYVGDSAIDDVSLLQMDCSMLDSVNTTDISTEASMDSCRGRCQEWDSLFSCGCTDDCWANNTCCSDYTKICTARNNTADDASESPQDINPTEELIPAIVRTTNSELESTVDIRSPQTESVEVSTTPSPTDSMKSSIVNELPKTVPPTTVPVRNSSRPFNAQNSTYHTVMTTWPVDYTSRLFTAPSTQKSISTTFPTTITSVPVTTPRVIFTRLTTRSTIFINTKLPVTAKNPQTTTAKYITTRLPLVTRKSTTPRLSVSTLMSTTTRKPTATTKSMSTGFPFTTMSSKPLTSKAATQRNTPVPSSTYSTKLLPSSSKLTTRAASFLSTTSFATTTPFPVTMKSSSTFSDVKPTTHLKTSSLTTPAVISTLKQAASDVKSPQNTSTISAGASTSAVESNFETTSPLTPKGTVPVFTNAQAPVRVTTSTNYTQGIPVTTKTQSDSSSTLSTESLITRTTVTTRSTANSPKVPQLISTSTLSTAASSLKQVTLKSTKLSSITSMFTTGYTGLSGSSTKGVGRVTKVAARTEVVEVTTGYDKNQERYSDSRPSKSVTKSTSSSSTSEIVGVTFGTFLLVAVLGGAAYMLMRRRKQTKVKLPEDSEMRFLSDNEVLEYSDSTALDKMLLT